MRTTTRLKAVTLVTAFALALQLALAPGIGRHGTASAQSLAPLPTLVRITRVTRLNGTAAADVPVVAFVNGVPCASGILPLASRFVDPPPTAPLPVVVEIGRSEQSYPCSIASGTISFLVDGQAVKETTPIARGTSRDMTLTIVSGVSSPARVIITSVTNAEGQPASTGSIDAFVNGSLCASRPLAADVALDVGGRDQSDVCNAPAGTINFQIGGHPAIEVAPLGPGSERRLALTLTTITISPPTVILISGVRDADGMAANGTVTALVGATVCGSQQIPSTNRVMVFTIGQANQPQTCAATSGTIRFEMNGKAANETATIAPSSQQTMTLTLLRSSIVPNGGQWFAGPNDVVVQGDGSAAVLARMAAASSDRAVNAIWYLFAGTWRYYLPPFPSLDGGLASVPGPVAAIIVVLQ